MKNVIRAAYLEQEYKVASLAHEPSKVQTFYSGIGEKLVDILSTVITGVEAREDILLKCFVADRESASFLVENINGLTLLVFPSQAEIQGYNLNFQQNFMSNAHTNPDPLHINHIERGLHIHPTKTESFIEFGEYSRLPNRICDMLLFLADPFKNPKRYPLFEEFQREDPIKIFESYRRRHRFR